MRKFLIIAVVLIVAGSAVYFVYNGKSPAETSDISEPSDETPSDQELAPVEPDPIFAEPVTYTALNRAYSGQGFSFKYSDGFKVSSSLVEGGEMVTVENSKGSGFQIFVAVFDEPGPITPERIWQDMPDMEINNPKNAQLDGSKTLVFNGYDGDFGETFEAWTVYKGKLYEITGPKTAEKLVIETLETWSWK